MPFKWIDARKVCRRLAPCFHRAHWCMRLSRGLTERVPSGLLSFEGEIFHPVRCCVVIAQITILLGVCLTLKLRRGPPHTDARTAENRTLWPVASNAVLGGREEPPPAVGAGAGTALVRP